MIEFTSIIRQKEGMNAAFVEFPFSTQELFGKKGQVKVRAVFDGRVEYRGSLARMGSTCHLLGLTQEVRTRLGKSFGDTVKVELEEDKEERIVTLPEDVQQLLQQHPDAARRFAAWSYTRRKEHIRDIAEARKPETRERHKQKLPEALLAGNGK